MSLRRSALVIVVAVLVVVAGCMAAVDDTPAETEELPEPGAQYGIYEAVPPDSNVIVQADVVGFLEDPVTADTGDHLLDVMDEEQTYEELLEEAFDEIAAETEAETGHALDLRDLGEVVFFAELDYEAMDDPDYNPIDDEDELVGFAFAYPLEEETLGEIMAEIEAEAAADDTEDLEVEIYEYEGADVMRVAENGEELYFAALNERHHVVTFSEPELEAAVDAYMDVETHLDPEMIPAPDRETYFSVTVDDVDVLLAAHEEELERELEHAQEDPTIAEEDLEEELEQLRDIPHPTVVTASYYTDGAAEANLALEMTLPNEEAAQEWERLLRDADDEVEEIDLDVGLRETEVSIGYSMTTDEIAAVIDDFAPLLAPPAGPDSDAPRVEFDFEYDADAAELTIAHAGGDAVPAEELDIMTMDREVSWAELSEADEVVAGERVVLEEVEPGEFVDVWWNDGTGGFASLATFEVPADEEAASAPEASFRLDDGEVLEITHTGGDEIPADELQIVLEDGGAMWMGLADDDIVSEGDSVTIEPELYEWDDGEALRLVWIDWETGEEETLEAWEAAADY